MADSTLTAIRTKVRRLTRSPSTSNLTNAEIDEYVNTFVLYDFPEHLRLISLRAKFTFYTEPYVDEYDSDNPATQLSDFKNKYITFHDPVFIDGRQTKMYQDREQFFGIYPRNNSIVAETNGDGVTTSFSGTLTNKPIIKNNVLFSSIAADNSSIELHDFSSGTGTTGILGGSGVGTIDYVTGVYDLDFSTAPASGKPINSHTIPYVASRPQSILFFDNIFTVRPIPEQAYRVDMEVYKRPTALLDGQSPELEQWWQYIAIASAVKILYDRTDFETAAQLQPLLKQHELLVLRKTIVQQTKERVYTIYTDDSGVQGSYPSRNNY